MEIQQIDHAIVERTRPQMYRFMKYWGKKPHNIFRAYIEHYSKENEIVLDAFAGIGICPFESIQANRKTIAVDLNPVATFIMKMIATPFDKDNFMKAYKSLHDEMINFENETKLFKTTCIKCKKQGRILSVHFDGNRPKLIRYRCICSKENQQKPPDEEDVKVIAESEKLKPKWWYPEDEFPNSPTFENVKKNFGKYFYNLWTKRVFYFLSFLYDKIEDIEDKTIKNFMKYTFISMLHLTTKMVASRSPQAERPDSGSWGRPAYMNLSRFREQNPFFVFERRVFNKNQGLLVSKESSNELLGNKVRFANNFDELKSSNKNFLLLQKNSIELTKFIPEGEVDYVLTDPPYGDLIKYFDLSSIWSVWLKGKEQNPEFEMPYEQEIITHDIDDKESLGFYEKMMLNSFKEIYKVLKPDHYMTLTFHNQHPKVFDLIIKVCKLAEFDVEKILFQPNRRASESGVANPWGSAIVDYYIRCKKPTEKEKRKEGLNKEGFEKLVVESAKDIIAKRMQPTELPFIIDEIWVELYKYGQYFETSTEDIISILNKRIDIDFVKIPVEEEKKSKLEKWWLKNPEKVIKHPEIPLSERIQKVVIQTLFEMGKVSFDDVMSKLYETFPNSLTPATDGRTVKEFLKEYANKTKDGKWVLKQSYTVYESEHIKMERFLAEIGQKLGFDIWCPDKNKDENLKEICIPKLELKLEKDKLERIKEIDILWLKDDKIFYSFDVENKTLISEALIRSSNLPDTNFTKKCIILPKERINLLERKLKEPMFRDSWNNQNWLLSFYDDIERFYHKRTINLEEFDKIFSKEVRSKEEKQKTLHGIL